MEEVAQHVAGADKVLVVGTSLSVYPAASLVEYARQDAEKVLNSLEMETVPAGFEFRPGRATVLVPDIIASWSSPDR
jgi:NAD-dependent deacetylase